MKKVFFLIIEKKDNYRRQSKKIQFVHWYISLQRKPYNKMKKLNII